MYKRHGPFFAIDSRSADPSDCYSRKVWAEEVVVVVGLYCNQSRSCVVRRSSWPEVVGERIDRMDACRIQLERSAFWPVVDLSV